MKKIVLITFINLLFLCFFHISSQNGSYAQQDWQQEYAFVCVRTQNSMELSVAELKDRIERCDKLQERINKLEGPRAETAKLRMDNGPELTSVRLAEWSEIHGVDLDFIQPGKPTQNSFVERFNRTYREELLDMYVFSRLSEVRNLTEKWLKEYNEE